MSGKDAPQAPQAEDSLLKIPIYQPPMSPLSVMYSDEKATAIVDHFTEGKSLFRISHEAGMPSYGTILRWLHGNKPFRDRLNAAREVRAIHFEEQALDAAENVSDKDEVPAARLKFDAMKWAAEVNDAARFGKRTTIAGDQNNPVQFIISTGFPDLLPEQKQPKLGSDGLIEKTVVAEVVAQAASTPAPAVPAPADVNEELADLKAKQNQLIEEMNRAGKTETVRT
jgi:hypothetical protein